MNYGNQIQQAYNYMYMNGLELNKIPEFDKNFNMYIWSDKQSKVGSIYYPHGDAYHLDEIGISLEEIKNSISKNFCNKIAKWIQAGYCFIFAGYSCSDNLDVNPIFKEINKGNNSICIILNHVNEASQEKIQLNGFKKREFDEIFTPFDEKFALYSVTKNFFKEITINDIPNYRECEVYSWKNKFMNYALNSANENAQKYLVIGICKALNINNNYIVKNTHFKKSDRRLFKSDWYTNYHLFQNSDMIHAIKYVPRMRPKRDPLALSDIFSKFGLWGLAAKAMRKSPQVILDELEHIKSNEKERKNIIGWDISTALNRYSDWFIMYQFFFPLQYKYYLKKHINKAKTVMNCYEIILEMGNDILKDVRQQFTAMRYLGILRMLFDSKYEVAINNLREAAYQYSSVSINSGTTTCKLFMCLVEIDKYRKGIGDINLREKVEMYLNSINKNALNNRRNRFLKNIIMLYVMVYEIRKSSCSFFI